LGTVFLQVLDETFFGSFTIVVNGSVLLTLGVELDSGETGDADGFDFVSSGIHLGDGNTLNVLKSGGELSINRGKGLAMAAPGSVVFNKDVVIIIHDDIIEVLTDNDLDVSFIIGFGELFGLEERLELVFNEVRDEALEVVSAVF